MTAPSPHTPLHRVAYLFGLYGWVVGPTWGKRPGGKGTSMGKGWPEKWTADPIEAERLLKQHSTATGIGALMNDRFAIDIDAPDKVPADLAHVLDQYGTCWQPTRRWRHYFFLNPDGRPVGNRGDCDWGEIKGWNSMGVVFGPHPDSDRFRYSMDPAVPVPECPDELLPWLSKPGDPDEPFTDWQFDVWQYEHDREDRRSRGWLGQLVGKVDDDLRRARGPKYGVFLRWTLRAAIEADGGAYPAEDAYRTLWDMWRAAYAADGEIRESEYRRMWRGAAAKVEKGHYAASVSQVADKIRR